METPPPLPSLPPQAPEPVTTSLPARLINVFAEPGQVFEEIKNSPPASSNWLVPVMLWVLVSVIASFILFSQPSIQHQVREQQAKAMDKMVEQGKMTREQADQATAVSEKFLGPTMLMIFGSVGAAGAAFAHVFWWALVLWLLGRWLLKSQFPYLKALEVAGLSMMVWVLSAILGLLLGIITGRMIATPSAALLISEFDLTNKSHILLATLNPFHLWLVLLMAIGLSKLAGVPFFRAAVLVLGCWILEQGLFIVTPRMGQMAL